MFRRPALTLAALFAVTALAAPAAAADTPGGQPTKLTPREQAGLQFASKTLDTVLGGLLGLGR
ncbi:hypothetical protein FM076_30510 [Streptomyces albus subsp. chlorinus]|uniref:hypothetical protein n=1 Tax=Streptomyces albus TaxID=1888 RepID=UPI0015715781|nr:hypothetical protein [Streptomyces albus]NSC25252.1 hypothetical protein [Streptomyces albus subsp. chlorinus]